MGFTVYWKKSINFYPGVYNFQELMTEQRAGHSCCQCAWTSDGGMLILQADDPGCGTAPLQICDGPRQSAWCKSHPGEASINITILLRRCCYFDHICITGCTQSNQSYNCLCSQWRNCKMTTFLFQWVKSHQAFMCLKYLDNVLCSSAFSG